MNPYAMLASGTGTNDAAALTARLLAWHDAMVAHERRLWARGTNGICDDECPHAEARTLWSEAIATFGTRADDLTFLRSRATGACGSIVGITAGQVRSDAAESDPPHRLARPQKSDQRKPMMRSRSCDA